MKLTVVIVSYNERKYIEKAIESCLNQEFEQDFEVIIGDDGSNDGSIELINSYVMKYPEKIRSFVMDRENVGDIVPSIRVSNILRRAFDMSLGEYLMVLSGDDYFCDKTKFKKQADLLDKEKKFISCYTDYQKVWDNGEVVNICADKIRSNSLFWSYYYMHISCFMFRRIVLDELPERFFDDTGLIFSILKSGKIYHIPSVMFSYRQRDGSIMHEADIQELDILELLLFQDVKNIKGFGVSSLSRFYRPLVRCYKNYEKLNNQKYDKYFNIAALAKNDLLNCFRNYKHINIKKKVQLKFLLFRAVNSYLIFRILKKGNNFLNQFN